MRTDASSIDVAAPADCVWDERSSWAAGRTGDRPCGRPGWTTAPRRLSCRCHRVGADVRVGVSLPFEVDGWSEDGPRRSWSWRVGGVRATEHSVTVTGPRTCRLEMSVPWWAPAYLGVIAVALRRIRQRTERA